MVRRPQAASTSPGSIITPSYIGMGLPMHSTDLSPWQYSHASHQDDRSREHSALAVTLLTAVTMVVEITAGTVWGSMALLADGWHMGTHAAALGLAAFVFWYARRTGTLTSAPASSMRWAALPARWHSRWWR